MSQIRPKAFISCSLRKEDQKFINYIVRLAYHYGFMPFGTVGKFTASPIPIFEQIKNQIQNADCLILAATPRYIQEDVYNGNPVGNGLSEMLHAELGMALSINKPVLVFIQKGAYVGTLISGAIQYIEIDLVNVCDLESKRFLIKNYFWNSLQIINEKWKKQKNDDMLKLVGVALAIIGAVKVLDSIINDDDNIDQ